MKEKLLKLIAALLCFSFMFDITTFAEVRLDAAGQNSGNKAQEISLRGAARPVYSLEISNGKYDKDVFGNVRYYVYITQLGFGSGTYVSLDGKEIYVSHTVRDIYQNGTIIGVVYAYDCGVPPYLTPGDHKVVARSNGIETSRIITVKEYIGD